METFAKLFARFLVFVYHCFDRIVIQGYLPLLTRPEHIVHFFRDVHGQYPITPQVLAKRGSGGAELSNRDGLAVQEIGGSRDVRGPCVLEAYDEELHWPGLCRLTGGPCRCGWP